MGRYGIEDPITGTVKSIQHIGVSQSFDGNQNVSITAVSATTKAYIVSNSSSATRGGAAGSDTLNRSYGAASPASGQLTSTTNVNVKVPAHDIGQTIGEAVSAVYKGSVVEVY
mgnify:CR=1 FL=1